MNKIQEVVQKLRSSSESEKASTSGASVSVSGNEPCSRSKFYVSTDTSASDQEPVWVTDASHMSASHHYQGLGSKVIGYLHNLPIHSTAIPLVSSTSSLPDYDSLSLDSTSQAMSSVSSPYSISTGSPYSISAQAMQKTVYQSLLESSTTSGVSSMSTVSGSHPPLERKSSKPRQQPEATFEYTVKDGDTLDRIGAHYDVTPSELIKINKMLSRTVFEGQTMFIPDPNHVPVASTSTSQPTSPVKIDTRPKVDVPLANLGDRSPPAVPGHVVQITNSPVFKADKPQRRLSEQEENELDDDCQQNFVKIRSRLVLEEADKEQATFGSLTIRGTLLVTPNAIMFDPDVNDSYVIQNGGQSQFSTVVYMENVKGAAMYKDLYPRFFWKQSQEVRSRSPRPELYKPDKNEDQSDHSMSVSSDTRPDPEGQRHSPEGANAEIDTEAIKSKEAGIGVRRMSDELENMTEMTRSLLVSPPQPGRASQEVEHMLTSLADINSPGSFLQQQMSRSSELAGTEMALLDEISNEIGATRDFGPHMGRSSSEMSKQGLHANHNPMPISSPRESSNSGLSMDRSDSTNDALMTPTQGFAPVFFTDRSPNSAMAAPKPVSGQKSALHLSKLGSLSEDTEKRLSGEVTSSLEGQALVTDDDISQARLSSDNYPEAKLACAISTVPEAKDTASLKTAAKEKPSSVALPSDISKVTSDMHQMVIGTQSQECKQEVFSDSPDGRVQPGSSMDTSSKSSISSPLASSFSPLKTPAQHISSFFNYTTGFFRGSDKEKNGGAGTPTATSTPASEDSALNKISKNLPSFQFPSSLIPGAFANSSSSSSSTAASASVAQQLAPSSLETSCSTDGKPMEDLTHSLGPPISSYFPRSDSPQFMTSPMYLQIRTGVPTNQDPDVPKRHAIVRQISGKLMEEYWFVIPMDRTKRLYRFIAKYMPDAYGDQESCQARERFFRSPKDVTKRRRSKKSKTKVLIEVDYYGHDRSFQIWGQGMDSDSDIVHIGYEDVLDDGDESVSEDNDEDDEETSFELRREGKDEAGLPNFINGPSTILNNDHVLKLMSALPRNMSVGYDWALVFSTSRHGFSLQQLYREMKMVDDDFPVILCLLDTDHNLFGAYLSNTIHQSEGFYGSGSTFLFTFYPEFKPINPSLPRPPWGEQHYHWQGDNCYFMNGTRDSFAIGSGQGIFGLWLDGDLDKGCSHMCTTFDNEILTTKEDFHIVNIEVWQLTDATTG